MAAAQGREMGALDFTELPPAHTGRQRDEFELFAGGFLVQESFRILEGVDRGPDAGRDLIVEETRSGPGGDTIVRWLVSCKHKAHGGASVTVSDEANIRDRIETNRCTGLIAFYSTVPSSGLSDIFRALPPKYGVIIYDPAHIERKLVDSPGFRKIAARYLPKSFNAWMQESQYAVTSPSPDPQFARNSYFFCVNRTSASTRA